MKKDLRVVVITEIIAPYRIPLFNEISKHYESFHVLFLKETNYQREWIVETDKINFSYSILPGFTAKTKYGSPFYFNFGTLLKLKSLKADVVICGGYNHLSYLSAIAYRYIFRKDLILWVESTIYDHRYQSSFLSYYKKFLISLSNRFLVPGTMSRRYLESFKVKYEDIWIARNAVESKRFVGNAKDSEYEEKILKLLCVSRLEEHKGILDLFKAIQSLNQEGIRSELDILGSGPQEKKLKDFIEKNGLTNIKMHGFLQQSELKHFYSKASLFIMPSHSDPWGLVINEALSSGVPVIASVKAGGTCDLIINDYNGYVFEPGDVEELVGKIQTYLSLTKEEKNLMRNNSRDYIKHFSMEKSNDGFVEAINNQPNLSWITFKEKTKFY